MNIKKGGCEEWLGQSCPSAKNTAISRKQTRESSIPRFTEPLYHEFLPTSRHAGSHASGPILTIVHSRRTLRQKQIVLCTASPTRRTISPNVKLDDRFVHHQQAIRSDSRITPHPYPYQSSTNCLPTKAQICSALCPSLSRADFAPGAWLMSSGLRHHA